MFLIFTVFVYSWCMNVTGGSIETKLISMFYYMAFIKSQASLKQKKEGSTVEGNTPLFSRSSFLDQSQTSLKFCKRVDFETVNSLFQIRYLSLLLSIVSPKKLSLKKREGIPKKDCFYLFFCSFIPYFIQEYYSESFIPPSISTDRKTNCMQARQQV